MKDEDMTNKQKKLNNWNGVKGGLDSVTSRSFRTGDVWWCAVGENAGVEINGKNAPFSRLVLVYKKLNKWSFVGIPITSREKYGSWYMEFDFHGRAMHAVLAQIRLMSVKRLYKRMGSLDENDKLKVKLGLKAFLDA